MFAKGKRNISGFTLIELAIIITAVGLFMSIAMNEYNSYANKRYMAKTNANSDLIGTSLSSYIAIFGRLPCPADPTLPFTDPNAGLEVCLCKDPPPGAPPPPDCTIPETVIPANIGGVQRILGDYDADGDGSNDPVLTGSVPYVTLGLTQVKTLDAWGGAFFYGVSEHVTRVNTYNKDNGVVGSNIRSRTTGIISPELSTSTNLANNFPFVVLSHGKDNAGAYGINGNLLAPCNLASLDSENCDGDAQFITTDPFTRIYSLVSGASYFDDVFSFFVTSNSNDKWIYTSTNKMENKTSGFVGVGTNQPEYPLHVDGNILITGIAPQARTSSYCDANGSNCFDPRILVGTAGLAMTCDTVSGTGIMTGINNSNTDCLLAVGTSIVPPANCDSIAMGTFLTGIDAGGNILCAP